MLTIYYNNEDVFRAFSLFPQSFHILCGDFNCVLAPIDIENGIGFNQKFCASLKDLVFSFNLSDPFRTKFPQKEEYTFNRPGKAASRLDKFYIPSSYTDYLAVNHIASLSDHCAVFLEINTHNNLLTNSRFIGRNTYWKLVLFSGSLNLFNWLREPGWPPSKAWIRPG